MSLSLSLLPVVRLCVAPNMSPRYDIVYRRAHQAGDSELRRAWAAAAASTRWDPHHHRRLPDALREQRRIRHAQGPRLRAGQERSRAKGIHSVHGLFVPTTHIYLDKMRPHLFHCYGRNGEFRVCNSRSGWQYCWHILTHRRLKALAGCQLRRSYPADVGWASSAKAVRTTAIKPQ